MRWFDNILLNCIFWIYKLIHIFILITRNTNIVRIVSVFFNFILVIINQLKKNILTRININKILTLTVSRGFCHLYIARNTVYWLHLPAQIFCFSILTRLGNLSSWWDVQHILRYFINTVIFYTNIGFEFWHKSNTFEGICKGNKPKAELKRY